MTVHICCRGNWRHLVAGSFSYRSEREHRLACYLLDSVHHPLRLDDLGTMRLVTGVDIVTRDRASLDWHLTKALAHLALPQDWNMLGSLAEGEAIFCICLIPPHRGHSSVT